MEYKTEAVLSKNVTACSAGNAGESLFNGCQTCFGVLGNAGN